MIDYKNKDTLIYAAIKQKEKTSILPSDKASTLKNKIRIKIGIVKTEIIQNS